MGTRLRDQSMSTEVTTPLERIALTILAVLTVTWFLWAGMTGQENKQDRLEEEGTIPPVSITCTEDMACWDPFVMGNNGSGHEAP